MYAAVESLPSFLKGVVVPGSRSSKQPQILADRYRVERRIGAGAHATTWRGWDERLDRPVAIKILHAQLANDPVFVQRFRAEAKAAASVRQANVVDVYDFGQQDGELYIIMQYVDGEDLKSLIEHEAPMALAKVVGIIGNVLDGLQAIHAAGIVHRDIKPQNVLIGTDGIARVTDFGIAEVSSTSGLTTEGFTLGTVDYMAPEQAQGLPLTQSADLYATGVVLYEMLTGTLPFRGESSREVMLGHINGQVIPPGVRMPNRGIPELADAVVTQSLAKEPQRRFRSANAMKQAIIQALGSGTAAHTVMMQRAPSPRHRPAAAVPQETQQAWSSPEAAAETGSGLAGAFRALLLLLLIGALGVAAWGAYQVWQSDEIDIPFITLPGGNDNDEAPEDQALPTAVPTDVPQPTEAPPPPIEQQPTAPPDSEAPVEVPPTEIPPDTGNDVPVETDPTDIPVIVPIESGQPTDPPADQPAG